MSLRFIFQSDRKIYLVLDFFDASELFFNLRNEGRFNEKKSKFYSAQICLALECLHSNGIIYHDLSPENILLDNEGYVKITDFCLSKDSLKDGMVRHTFCGSPEYLAPEVLHQRGFGKSAVWWSFGTLLYEMMTGLPPFYNASTNLLMIEERPLMEEIPLHLPKYLSKAARSIFLGLLERDSKKRLGSSDKDALEIEQHVFYADIDWLKLYKKEIKPPFEAKGVEQEHEFEEEHAAICP